MAGYTQHGQLTVEQRKAHRITWWVYVGSPPERIRHEATMRGQWGWDATCSCGWDSRVGAGLRRAVQARVDEHKRDVRWGFA
jgi:hypothetical protein